MPFGRGVRKGTAVLLLAGMMAAALPLHARASIFDCTPLPQYFWSNPLTSSAVPELPEDSRKLSIREFPGLALQPSSSPVLQKGTELNVIVDTKCLLDRRRGPQALEFLEILKSKASFKARKRLDRQSHHWKLERDWGFVELQDALEAEPCVEMVSPDAHFYLNQVGGDPYAANQTHLARLRYFEALNELLLPMMIRHPVTVAIIDTGVDFSHPDLRANRWVNRREIPGNDRDDDQNGYVDDVNGYNFANHVGDAGPTGRWASNIHGTHVAGLAAARMQNGEGGTGIHGVAKIMSLNVFLETGESRSSILENAIRYAASQGATVINMSLGGNEYSRTMRSALEYAISRGSLVVAAAGNFGVELCDNPNSFGFISPGVYGGLLSGMLSVGSIDVTDGRFSRFSNYSRRLLEITAPGALTSDGAGSGLLSTAPGGGYVYLHGTSMATPIVSGTAALVSSWLQAYYYKATPRTIEKILKESAVEDPRLASSVQLGRTLDLARVVAYLKQNYPPRTKQEASAQTPREPRDPIYRPEPRPTPRPTPRPPPPPADDPDLPPYDPGDDSSGNAGDDYGDDSGNSDSDDFG